MDNYFLLYLVSQYWYVRCQWWESDEVNDKEYHDTKWGESCAFERAISRYANIWSGEIFDLWLKFYEDNYNSQGFADAIVARAN